VTVLSRWTTGRTIDKPAQAILLILVIMVNMKSTKVYNLIPDATLICSIFIAYALNNSSPIIKAIPSSMSLIGWMIAIVAFIIAISILSNLRVKHTSTDVAAVPSALVSNGFYLYTRNPFYLASLCVTIGVAIALGSLAAFVAPVIYFIVLHFIIIPIEEKNLHMKFRKEYEKYQQKTRRWL
jgi:protein-S-isoprenylcysteine O-methyltransferase Ste14